MTSLYRSFRSLNGPPRPLLPFGLVPSSTSDTFIPPGVPRRTPKPIEIDSKAARLRRMSKSVKTSARLHQVEANSNGSRSFLAMVTLTYAPDQPHDKRDISRFLKRVREWCRRRRIAFRYVWVMELHKSGRPHYHVLIWLPRGYHLPKPDKRGWWPKGSSRIEGAKKPVGYLAKYASKLSEAAQGEEFDTFNAMPKGARIHGAGGLSERSKRVRRWWLSPMWVRRLWHPQEDPRPAPGGGWLSRVLGTFRPSPWSVRFTNGRLFAHWVGWPEKNIH